MLLSIRERVFSPHCNQKYRQQKRTLLDTKSHKSTKINKKPTFLLFYSNFCFIFAV